MILFLKHINIEGPETLGDFFVNQGKDIRVLDLHHGHHLPKDLTDIEAVICLGGPMNVYEEDKYPFLKAENEFIKDVLELEIPFLGICLGSQLLAKACEASVVRSANEEIGFSHVALTEKGKQDPLFHLVPLEVFVFQWHGDMFELSHTGSLLASSQQCPHQAFRVGRCAYGIQFHIEITDKSIREWSEAYFDQGNEQMLFKKMSMLKEYDRKKELFNETAQAIYGNFLRVIEQRVEQIIS